MEWRWGLEEENKKKKIEMMMRDLRMALGRVRKRRLHRLPLISIVVLFLSFFFKFYFVLII